MRAAAVGDPFDQRRPQVAARPLDGPLRGRVHRQKVVAIDAQRRDAAAHAARGEGGSLSAGQRLKGRDGPLVVDDVEDDGRAVNMGKRQRRVKVGFGGRAVANPGRCYFAVALDCRGHAPAHGLDELRGEIAGDRKETGVAHRVHDRQLAPFERVAFVGQQLADQAHQRHIARHQQALLTVSGKAHVALTERQRVGRAYGFFAQALHVKRHFLLPLGNHHAVVKNACFHHRAQSLAQQFWCHLRRPGADGLSVFIEHPHQGVGKVAGVDRQRIHRGPPDLAGARQVQVGKVGFAAGAPGRLRYMQV